MIAAYLRRALAGRVGRVVSGLPLPVILLVPGVVGATEPTHPLDPLTAREYRVLLETLEAAGHWSEESRLPLATLDEPDKVLVGKWSSGEPLSRRAFAVVKNGRKTFEAVVDLLAPRVVSWRSRPGVQPGILLTDESLAADEIVRAYEPWQSAIRSRGILDSSAVVLVPLTAGYFGDPMEVSDRLVKVISFDSRGVGNYWGRPLEGLIAVVSLDSARVVELIDSGPRPIPAGKVDFPPDPGADTGASSESASTPAGYELDRHFVRWGSWRFHWRIDPRLGMVLSLARFGMGDQGRSVLYQGSLSEMFVPYTDPDVGWYFRAYMDAGEYGLGKLASPLTPGVDCPEGSTFLSSWFADEWGNAFLHSRIGCLFERRTGDVAWRHFEGMTGAGAGAASKELVVRTIPAVGNYDYVLDWIFRPDGTIRVSVGATGVPQVKATAGRAPGQSSSDISHGRWVAPHTQAVHHDHFFNFRLDFDVDGARNSFLKESLRPVQLESGPRASTWVVESETAAKEDDAKLRIQLDRPALWRVVNPSVKGPLGYPVGYRLVPGRNAVSLFDADDALQRRAGFTDFHLWVTPYNRAERHAAGDYPNQSRGGDGLPRWTSRNRPIEYRDIVLWYTLGMHHVVRAEEWPVMPTSTSGFELQPFDFFPRNPLLEAPDGRPSEQ